MTQHQSPDPYTVPEQETPPTAVSAAQTPPSDLTPATPEPATALENQPHGRNRVASTVAVLGLAISLAGWGWFASDNARTGWWTYGQHVAAEVDEQGWASVDTLSVRLSRTATVTAIEESIPPPGFAYLVVDLEVASEETEQARSCDVEVLDTEGRLFLAGREVPNGDPYTSSLMCGTSDPAEDPVPTDQSLLVLVPEGAEISSVRVSASDFPPATFIELPLP